MPTTMPTTHQHELREALPGARGGLALAEQRGASHMAAIGASGGAQTVRTHGAAYMKELARRGAQERWRRTREPKTIAETYAGELIAVYRKVRYRKAQAKRARVIFITLWEAE